MSRRVVYVSATDQFRLLFSRALEQVGYTQLVYQRQVDGALAALADAGSDALLLIHGEMPGCNVEDALIDEIRVETDAPVIFLGFPQSVFARPREGVLVVEPPITVARLAEAAASVRRVPATALIQKLVRTRTFEAFTADAVAFLLNHARARQLQPGEVLFEQGAPGDSMHIVLVGSIAISLGGRVLESVGPGGIFGEMAMLEGRARSARATAEGLTVVLEVDHAAIERGDAPFRAVLFELITRTTIRRLRAANSAIASLDGARTRTEQAIARQPAAPERSAEEDRTRTEVDSASRGKSGG